MWNKRKKAYVTKKAKDGKSSLGESKEEEIMNLKFGTGGLRAVMGEGPDCLNMETIREATMGVANYIKKKTKQPKVAICYDSRINSYEFAKETARVLAAKGCEVFISKTLMPTPFLSYVIRYLHCDLGVCITASHNGKEYNGYKVYGEDGCQITGKAAGEIQQEILTAESFNFEREASFEDYMNFGKIQFICEKKIEAFCKEILSYGLSAKLNDGVFENRDKDENRVQQANHSYGKEMSPLRVVYSPLNGAGKLCITKVLEAKGITDIHPVKEQSEPDGNFPTCPYPNPEDDKAMELGIKLSEEIKADIFLATDPDSDRVGVAALKGEKYERLNGNQVGVLLLDYMLSSRKENGTLPEKPIVIKTIVTTEMAEKIAKEYDAEVINTLTGFKYIGEKIGELEQKGELHRFVLGMEESCGYLIGPYARDKDAVGAAMMICEMADCYKKQGKTLWDRMEELYEQYGRFESSQSTQKFGESEAKEYMEILRECLRTSDRIEGSYAAVHHYIDFSQGVDGLPKSNVLKIWMQDGSTLIVRPSGTEPKIKFYREEMLSVQK